jgi:hypothetical protein
VSSVDPVVRVLSVALCAALALSVALVAGFLARLAGEHPAAAALRGGAAFAGAFGVLVLALTATGVL